MTLSLSERIAGALLKHTKLHIHHVAALPTSTDPLFVAARSTAPEPTELESHFLSVSIKHEGKLVQVFAIEVLAYTTSALTTLFVSKADSTGYLYLLDAPRSGRSLIQVVIAEFIAYLLESKRTLDSRIVLSLFARAQDQYLFPGSIENDKKHVLDDRGLIKWWAKIIEQILRRHENSESLVNGDDIGAEFKGRANIVVPGCDKHETRTFIPRDSEYKPSAFWTPGDPLQTLGKLADPPVRCLIPRFPDDPKARFAIDLDDELPDEPQEGASQDEILPKASDNWRSVRSLAQFWELMSFRQECSAGRLVGFLWGIWEPLDLVDKPYQGRIESEMSQELGDTSATNAADGIPTLAPSQSQATSASLPARTILAREPVPAIEASEGQPVAPQVQGPSEAAGSVNEDVEPPPIDAVQPAGIPPLVKQVTADIILKPDAYARCMALLLTLDYCDFEIAAKSTRDLLDSMAKEAGVESWGTVVEGRMENVPVSQSESGSSSATNLASLIRKRPKTDEVNSLSVGLIRKKPKS